MPDNIPSPGGALPPKKTESAKIQPKKETVRINLPPKPTSAPTIKLPTLAPGAPHGATSAAAAPVAAAPAFSKAATPPAAPGAPAVSRPATTAKPSAAPAPSAPRPMAAPSASGLTMLDKALAIAAAVATLAALGTVIYLVFILKDTAG